MYTSRFHKNGSEQCFELHIASYSGTKLLNNYPMFN